MDVDSNPSTASRDFRPGPEQLGRDWKGQDRGHGHHPDTVEELDAGQLNRLIPVSYTHLRAHETS